MFIIVYKDGRITMKKNNFREELLLAKENKYSIGAFNIFNYASAKAAIKAAEELDSTLILQTSTSTVKKIGAEELGKMLRLLADSSTVNVLIHLDHCTSVDLAKQCIDSGWDSVMIDASQFPLEDNIRITKEVVEYAHARGVYVEGELGTIEGIEDEISENEGKIASFEDSIIYVEATNIDAFAPSIGTAHGVYHGEPKINFKLIEMLKDSIKCPVVIHGGTGLSKNTFRQLIQLGASKINVSTAIKNAYLEGCKEYFKKYPDEVDPLGFDEYYFGKIKDVAKDHIQFFNPNKEI